MKTQKELTQLLSQKVEEINLSQQVELADTKEKFDATMKSIDTTYKAIQVKLKNLQSRFNKDPEPDGYVREINNVLESLIDINSSL